MIVHLSFDGLLQPLGWGQVARPLMALADRGYPYRIVSLERTSDLALTDRVSRVRSELAGAGIEWEPLPYAASEGRASALLNLKNAFVATHRAARQSNALLVHARSYPAALVADAIRSIHGIDYLFDIRGYWIDERRDEGRWFSRASIYGGAKMIERRLFANCAGVVSLTDLATSDIREGCFGPWPASKPCATIPTCTDYDKFQLPEDRQAVRKRMLPKTSGKPLIGYVGSINASYLVNEAFELFARLLDKRPDAHLLCATQQVEEAHALAKVNAIPASSITVQPFEHDEMPALLGALDWGLLLLAEPFSKRASMPTKLGEFFAAGVRPVVYGCNEEVIRWVHRAGTGLVLTGTDRSSLETAAGEIARAEPTSQALAVGRERTREHFDLPRGIDRYADVLDSLLARPS